MCKEVQHKHSFSAITNVFWFLSLVSLIWSKPLQRGTQSYSLVIFFKVIVVLVGHQEESLIYASLLFFYTVYITPDWTPFCFLQRGVNSL